MLDKVLHELAVYAENEAETRSKIKAALAYPCFLACVGAVTILVLLLFVIPKLTPVFEEFDQTLPLPTLIIVSMSNLLLHFGWVILILGVLAAWLLKKRGGFLKNSLVIDRLLLKSPVLGPLLQKREIARFAHTLGTLLHNGIPILKALEIVKENVRSPLFKKEVALMQASVTEGQNLGSSLKESVCFPLSLMHMIRVSEETGKLDQALENIAQTQDRELDRVSKVFTSLIEPVMILLLGSIIAIIVISMLLPIFNLQMGIG